MEIRTYYLIKDADRTYTWKQNANEPGHDTGKTGIQITLGNSGQTSLLFSKGNVRKTIPTQNLGGADSGGLWAGRNDRTEEFGVEIGGGLR